MTDDEYAPYIGAPGKFPPPFSARCAYCQEHAPHGMNDHLTAIAVHEQQGGGR